MTAPFKVIKGGRGPAPDTRGAGEITLTPCQRRAMDRLGTLIGKAPVIGLASDPGMGRTTLLELAAQKFGGHFVGIGDLIESLRFAGPDHWDIELLAYLERRLADTHTLYVDGLGIFAASTSRGPFSLQTLKDILLRAAEDRGKTLVLGGFLPVGNGTVIGSFFRDDVPLAKIDRFSAEDYEVIAARFMGSEKAAKVDFRQVYRFASLLNAHEVRVAASIAARGDIIDTDGFLAILNRYVASANTRTEEVEDIRFETMPGMDHIADKLETHVVLPLTDPLLAEELDLNAKRGVLLYGPPGTGKTSVGRALARRLDGRFFLIDGSVKTEPAYLFHGKVASIVNEAITNAPSVLFIDDADVLFDIGHVAGFGRYLLTVLDGLAGRNAAKVCVMMTAMDASKIPEAILRSGRVELWLETRAPDSDTRAGIIRRWMGDLLPGAAQIDYLRLGEATSGFTPADLRRIAGDSRAYYAADLDAGRSPADATAYAMRAIESVIATREAMATNLADPSLRVK